MLSEIVAAVAGGLATGVCTLFADDIKAKVYRRGPNHDLLGKWNCTWAYDHQAGKVTEDYVEISKAVGESVAALGRNTEAGNYKLVGRLSQSYLMTLTYSGDEKRSVLGGVVIMELNPTRDQMQGYWSEYGSDRKFIGGQVTWKKA